MATPFCTICERLGDSEGRLCCEAFPLCIPGAIYPQGCAFREPSAKGTLFKPKSGMEEIAKRWAELSK